MPFTIGQSVFVRGKGIASVCRIADDGTVGVGHSEEIWFEFATAQAETELRPLVSSDHADRLLALLTSGGIPPMDAEVGERAISYRRAANSGDLEELVRTLSAIYARQDKEYPEVQNRSRLEDLVFEWLGASLGRSPETLRAYTRSALFGETPPRWTHAGEADSLPSAPSLPGLRPMGTFAVDKAVAVGEVDALCNTATLLRTPVKPGIWVAYQRELQGDALELLVAHYDHVIALKSDAAVSWSALGQVKTHAGQVAIVDEEFVDHPSVVAAANGEVADAIVGERGVVSNTGPDPGGTFPVLAWGCESEVLALVVRFGQLRERRTPWWRFW